MKKNQKTTPKRWGIINTKEERGITLIALIIMVIILVILAAVTISSVYKSKVVDYAINGAINYSTEGVNENKVIEETANVIESAVNNITGVGGTGTLPNPSPDPGGSTTPEDKTPPIVNVTKGEVTTNSIQVSVTATDVGSGLPAIPKYTYYIRKSGETTYRKVADKVRENTYTYIDLEQGVQYDVKVEVEDMAGNIGAGSIKMITTEGILGFGTVTYNYTENGGTIGTVTTKQVEVGQKVDLTPTATKEGWNFAGWNTNKDAEAGLTEYTMPANNVTLYAIFSKDITVTYKTYNNQTKTETVKLSNNQTTGEVTLPSIANVTDSGVTYTMRGWSTQDTANASTTAAGTKVTITGNTTYYASYQTTINTTFYYNSNTTSGSLTVAQEIVKATRQMNYTGTKIEGSINIPTVVTGSVGKYNSSYKGVATAVNTTATTNTLTVGGTYYAVYSTPVTIYYPTSKTVATNMTKHRNEYFTSTSAMSVKLGDNNAVTTDFNFTSSVEGYSLYGFANVENTTTRTYSSISRLAASDVTTAYAILYKASGSKTYYTYCINTTTAKCTEPLTIEELSKIEMIGKYVNYVPAGRDYIVDGTYSGTGSDQTFSANNSMKWRIWGVEGNKLLLISETFAGIIKLVEQAGYNNGVKILNDACSTAFGNSSTYGSGAIKARSINQEDIDKVTNMATEEKRKRVNSSYGTTITISTTYRNCPTIYGYEPGKTGGGTLGRSTQYNNNWVTGISTLTSGKWTYYDYTITAYATQKIYDALLTNPTANSDRGTDRHAEYWVASRCVKFFDNDRNALFCMFIVRSGYVDAYDLYWSSGRTVGWQFATRPIVEVNLGSVDIGSYGTGIDTDPYSMAKK